MDIGVEISLYPLADDYIAPIAGFIERLNAHPGLRVVTNSMSTQVFGEYQRVFDVLGGECRQTFEEAGKAIFVMKVLGPLADPQS
jgi:uncharacterized protein YqgV (UPF0045/DUF77 family)